MKPKKGLIIGNSHAAMIVKAYRENPAQYAALDLAFLTQSGDGPSGVSFAPNHLRATDPALIGILKRTNCAVEYHLDNFDFIMVIGCGLSLYKVLPTINKTNVAGFPASQQTTPVISRACFHAVIEDILRTSLTYKYVTNLRTICNLPIIVAPQPLPSEKLDLIPKKGKSFERVIQTRNTVNAYRAFQQGTHGIFSNMANVTVIAQPEHTIAQNVYTKLEYTVGATRLRDVNKPQPDEDTLHANAKFGALILAALKRVVETTR